MSMPPGEWNEPAIRLVLGWATQLEEALHDNMARMKVHRGMVDKAREQAKPHPVDVTDVGLHEDCEGRGCADCGASGVVNAHTGESFQVRPPPPVAEGDALAERARRLREIMAIRRRIAGTADAFRELSTMLTRASHKARLLADHLDGLIQRTEEERRNDERARKQQHASGSTVRRGPA